jgi:hypothetical protein
MDPGPFDTRASSSPRLRIRRAGAPTNEELWADPVHQAWWEDLQRRGVLITSQPLRPVVDATTVRVRAADVHAGRLPSSVG